MANVTISGTTNLEDNYLDSFNSKRGTNAFIQIGSNTRAGLLRVITSAIPDGSYTGFRHILISIGGGGSMTSAWYQVAEANPWVENNSSRDYYDDPNTWVGSQYCRTSGTDYTADGSPATKSFNFSGAFTVDLSAKTSWLSDWKTGGFTNNGVVIQPYAGSTQIWTFNSTEAASNKQYVEIDYTEPATGGSRRRDRSRNRSRNRGRG